MRDRQPLIPLPDWGALNFDPVPSVRTLRSWASSGKIHPQPVLVGREYRCRPDAEYRSAPARKKRRREIRVIQSRDPIVHAIISGKT